MTDTDLPINTRELAEWIEDGVYPPPKEYVKCATCQRRVMKKHLRKTKTPIDVGWVLMEIEVSAGGVPTLGYVCRDCIAKRNP